VIGFYRQDINRRPLFSVTGKKLVYIKNGNIVTDLNDKPIAKILRYKNGNGPFTDSSACGGTLIHPEV
jgi:hypothetical protein